MALQQLVLNLLGGWSLHDGTGQEIPVASRKAQALLAVLGLRCGERQSRDRLATLLWEDADTELARASLRQALAALRKALPDGAPPVLVADTAGIGLDPAHIEVDVHALRSALRAGTREALSEAVRRYRGPLLDGFDARSSAFDSWLLPEQQQVRREALEAMACLAQQSRAAHDEEGEIDAWSRITQLEPVNESAHRFLMELYARRAAYTDALNQYRLCRDTLRRELDVAPEPATEALYRELMRRRRAARPEPVEPHTASRDDLPEAESSSGPEEPAGPQLREVTLMAVQMRGLQQLEAELDPESLLAITAALENAAERTAAQFSGMADRRVGSDVLLVFGAHMARGNEAERAIRAALALRSSLEDMRLPTCVHLSIGLAQGQALVRPGRQPFPLSGRPVTVALALAKESPAGAILLDDTLRQTLGERIVIQPSAEVLGRPAWSLQQLRPLHEAFSQVPLVGRQPELGLVSALLEQCATGRRGRVVLIRGEAGIGKTRLAAAVRGNAMNRGMAVHQTQCLDFGQAADRRPIAALAASLMGLDREATPMQRAAAVRQAASGTEERIFLSNLIDAPLDQDLQALEQAMDLATRQRGRMNALQRLLESAAGQQPQLIVVEDAHWASNEEIAALASLAPSLPRCAVLMLMTTRPGGDPINAAWRARARDCPVTTLDLAALTEDEARELAGHYSQLAPDIVAACVRRSEGHPLFLDQLLRAADANSGSLPGSVRSLVLARAEGLLPPDRQALQVAAVLGQQVPLDAVRQLLGGKDYACTALLEAGLLRQDGERLEFVHALFRDAIYESLLKSTRNQLHRQAAEWFASRDAILHADHLAAASDPAAATAYLAAARQELAALRYERGLALAESAKALGRDPATLHRVCDLLGQLLMHNGRTHDALAAYRESLDFADSHQTQASALFGIASALRIMDRYEEALETLERAEAATAGSDDAAFLARLYRLRGNLCFPLGRMDDCLHAHQNAYAQAQRAGLAEEEVLARGGLGDAWYQRGRMLTAHDNFGQCVDYGRQHGSTRLLLGNLPMLAVTSLYGGRFADAIAHCTEALDIARKVGDLRTEILANIVISSAEIHRGRYEAARQSSGLATIQARRIGARRFEAECLALAALACGRQGMQQEALQQLNIALALARETGMSYCGPVVLSAIALFTPDAAECTAALSEGERLLANDCVSHSYLEFYANAIDVSLKARKWDEVLRYAQALVDYTAEEPLPWANYLIDRARLLAQIGDGSPDATTRSRLSELRERGAQMSFITTLELVDIVLARTA